MIKTINFTWKTLYNIYLGILAKSVDKWDKMVYNRNTKERKNNIENIKKRTQFRKEKLLCILNFFRQIPAFKKAGICVKWG